MHTPGKIIGIKAAASSVLIELLSTQEALGTKLTILNNKNNGGDKMEAFQAYVLDVGPALDIAKLGFKIGDRIALSGGFVPLPSYDDSSRQKGIIDAHSVKAVLKESSAIECS